MSDKEKTVVKGMSFCGISQDGNTIQVDVKNGKIVRIRPFHFDWKYSAQAPETVENRGARTGLRTYYEATDSADYISL